MVQKSSSEVLFRLSFAVLGWFSPLCILYSRTKPALETIFRATKEACGTTCRVTGGYLKVRLQARGRGLLVGFSKFVIPQQQLNFKFCTQKGNQKLRNLLALIQKSTELLFRPSKRLISRETTPLGENSNKGMRLHEVVMVVWERNVGEC
jgi:hypothetical protein